MKELRIAKELSLPLDAVTQKLAFLGRTGSGKTYGAKRMVEEMIRAGAQVVILDPVGVWAGLRLGPKALDVAVLGGLFGDIPLESTAGALVADLAVDTGTSLVLDVSQMRDAERTRFAQAFGERFFQRKKAAPSAVHLVIEECQEFIPQNPQPGEQRMLHEFQHLAKLGRNFGIGISLITQRPQEVSKKALNQSECIFAFQLTGPHERKALEYWLSDKGLGEKLSELLPRLKVGAPHVWSPQWLQISKVVHILPIETQDTSQTPKVGDVATAQRKLKAIDLPALRTAMAAAIERDEQENPERLRARIAELEAQLADETEVLPAEPVRVEVQVISDARLHRLERAAHDFQKASIEAIEAARDLVGALPSAQGLTVTCYVDGCTKPGGHQGKHSYDDPPVAQQPAARRAELAATPKPAPKAPPAGTSDDSLSAGERLILTAAAQHQGRELSVERLALLIGVHARGKGYRNNLGALRSSGALQGTMITDAGLRRLGSFERLPTGRALLEWYCANKLAPAEARMLKAIAAGNAPSIGTLAAYLDVHERGKGFRNNLGRLRGLGLVDGLKIAAVLR